MLEPSTTPERSWTRSAPPHRPLAPAVASAEAYVAVDLSELDDIRDQEGTAVTVLGDAQGASGNREISGETASGEPFRIVIYRGLDPSQPNALVETIAVAATTTSALAARLREFTT